MYQQEIKKWNTLLVESWDVCCERSSKINSLSRLRAPIEWICNPEINKSKESRASERQKIVAKFYENKATRDLNNLYMSYLYFSTNRNKFHFFPHQVKESSSKCIIHIVFYKFPHYYFFLKKTKERKKGKISTYRIQ